MQETFDVLGVHIAATDLDRAVLSFDSWITQNHKVYVCVAPVSTLVDCQSDKKYKNIVNNAAMATPDGMPVVWLGKLKGASVKRTYGPDLFLRVCEYGQERGYRHFFYGGSEEVIGELQKRLKQKFGDLNIVGSYSPKFLETGELESQDTIDYINQCQPDIVWIGLGSPKQDIWMFNHRAKLNAPVLAGVGAAFDFISGAKKQAPKWIQKSGFEWFFRLCCEPRRLWKRYLVGNSKFIFFIIKDYFQNILKV